MSLSINHSSAKEIPDTSDDNRLEGGKGETLEDPSSQQDFVFCLAALCDGGTDDCHQYGEQKDGSFAPFAGKGAIKGTRIIIQSRITVKGFTH
jgi:hypothetical protein